jgi:hypothetical protein
MAVRDEANDHATPSCLGSVPQQRAAVAANCLTLFATHAAELETNLPVESRGAFRVPEWLAQRRGRISFRSGFVRLFAVTRRRLARFGGGISVPRRDSDPAEGLRRAACTLMRKRGRIMRAGGPIHCLVSVPTRHVDSAGCCGCAFRRREPPVLDVWASLSKRNHATAGLLASPSCGLGPERGCCGCVVRTTRDTFRPIDIPLHAQACSLR